MRASPGAIRHAANMKNAVNAVVTDNCSIRKAAARNRVAKSTLHARAKKDNCPKNWQRTVLTKEKEK